MSSRCFFLFCICFLCSSCTKNSVSETHNSWYDDTTKVILESCQKSAFDYLPNNISVSADLQRMNRYTNCLNEAILRMLEIVVPQKASLKGDFQKMAKDYKVFSCNLNLKCQQGCTGSFAQYEYIWEYADFLSVMLNQLVLQGKAAQVDFMKMFPLDPEEYSTHRENSAGKNVLGITADLLSLYHHWRSPVKSPEIVSDDLQDLTPDEAKQIAYEMYYLSYGVNQIKNLFLARHVFDQTFNLGEPAIINLQKSLYKMTGEKIAFSGVIDQPTIDVINRLTEAQITELSDLMAKQRLDFYFQEVQRRPENRYNLQGWIERGCSYFSEPNLCQPYKKKAAGL